MADAKRGEIFQMAIVGKPRNILPWCQLYAVIDG